MQAAFVVLLALLIGTGGTTVPVSTRILRAGDSHALDVPSFRFYGMAQTDKEGDLYFHVEAGSYRKPVILKLARSTGDPTLYTLADGDQNNIVFAEFSVTPSGQVVILGMGKDGKNYAIHFSTKGAATTKTLLELPEHMSIGSFVAFESGTMLVSAFYLPDAPEELRGKSFMSFFNDSGKLVRKFDGELGEVDLKTAFQHAREGDSAIGPDGNLYLLTANKILVISESGEIVRRLKYQKPENRIAGKIAVSHNLIAIWMLKEGAKHEISSEYLVLDLFTGKPFGFYVPAEELGKFAVALSFSNEEGFTFFDNDNGHIKLISAPLR